MRSDSRLVRRRVLPRGLPFVLALACLACDGLEAPSREPRQRAPRVEPLAESDKQGLDRAYVSNEDSGTITIIDTRTDTRVGSIYVGKRPRGMRLSADARTLYVAVSGSAKAPPGTEASELPPPNRKEDGIAVVDLRARRVVRILESGTDPECFDLSNDATQVFVSNEDAGMVSILDIASGKRTFSLKVGGEPEGVTTRPDGAVFYVTSEEDGHVSVVDPQARRVIATIPTGPRPRNVLFTRDSQRAFVSCENGASVRVIDARQHRALGEIPMPRPADRPMGLALAPDEKTLFVSTGRGRSVVVIDLECQTVRKQILDVGVRPWGLAVTSDGRKLYTANGPSHDVAVIDVAVGRVVKRLKAEGAPWGVVVSPSSRPARHVEEYGAAQP